MTILIVDDNQINLFLIENILKRAGYTDYSSLTSAKAMFDYLETEVKESTNTSVDLILLDIMMPEMDGIEACKILQDNPKFKDIPIIFVTAIEDSKKVAEALDVGGIDYITKPINKTDLLARIRVGLRLKYEKDWHKKHEKKIQDELELSMQVQRGLLSKPLIEERFNVNASYLPANQLAGDMYYWQKIDEDRYGVILLDVMGHGITSSLVCMYISSALRDAIRKNPDPVALIEELNRWMNILNQEKNTFHYYFTAIYLVIDTKNNIIEYVNAGHPPGFLLVEDQRIITLSTNCCPVGLFREMKVKKTTIEFKEKIQVLIYTDGVMEALDDINHDGLEELKKLVINQKFDNIQMQEPIEYVLPKELQIDQPDDMCVIMIQAGNIS